METVENKRTCILVTIKGDKVQNVGYIPFLLEKAVRLKIKNFDAVNVESEIEKMKITEKQKLMAELLIVNRLSAGMEYSLNKLYEEGLLKKAE